MESSINNRVQRIIDVAFGGNKSAFAKKVGISATVVENIVGKRQGKPSFDILIAIFTYANIAAEWLLTGKGDMFNTDDNNINIVNDNIICEATPEYGNNNIGEKSIIPDRLHKEIDTNIVEIIRQMKDIEKSPIVSQFPTYDFVSRITTESMLPDFKLGDRIALKICKKDMPIISGSIYAIDTRSGFFVRIIYDNGDEILAKPLNRDRFEDIIFQKKDIYTFFKVVGMLRLNF